MQRFETGQDNEWARGIPWWWVHGPKIMALMSFGDAMVNFMLMFAFLFAVPIGLAGMISTWGLPGFLISLTWTIPILWLVGAELYAGIRYHRDSETTRSRYRDLRVAEYRSLPRSYTRKLRSAAKDVDDPEVNGEVLLRWQSLIDGLYSLHGNPEEGHAELKKFRPKSRRSVDQLAQYVDDEREKRKIARELEQDVRNSLTKQGIDLKGIDPLYG